MVSVTRWGSRVGGSDHNLFKVPPFPDSELPELSEPCKEGAIDFWVSLRLWGSASLEQANKDIVVIINKIVNFFII